MPATISPVMHKPNCLKSPPFERESSSPYHGSQEGYLVKTQELVNPPYKRLQLGAWPRAERTIFGFGRGVEMGIIFEARL